MRLSAKPILTFANVNVFSYGNQWTVRAGELNVLHFQLVDLDQAGLRYMVGVGVSNQPFAVSMTVPSINDSAVLVLSAVQADPSDSSIWKVTIPASSTLSGGNMQFSVTEGAVTRKFNVLNVLAVEYLDDGSC